MIIQIPYRNKRLRQPIINPRRAPKRFIYLNCSSIIVSSNPSSFNKSREFTFSVTIFLISRSVPAGTKEILIQNCCEIFAQIYSENWKKNCCPYKGIDIMLSNLSAKGIKLAVLSNKPHAFTCLFADHFFPKDTFEIVSGQRDGVNKKPDPAGALAIAGLLQTHPENILFVGDSDVDIQTGRNAGMGTVGVSWGYRNVTELLANNAEIIVNSPLEIVKYVLSAA